MGLDLSHGCDEFSGISKTPRGWNKTYILKPRDTAEMSGFCERMGTPEAKDVYKRRSCIAEFPNADCRNRGLIQFRKMGLIKAKSKTPWHVVASIPRAAGNETFASGKALAAGSARRPPRGTYG